MPKTLRIQELDAPEATELPQPSPAKRQKLSVLLVTQDDALWSQVGTDLNGALVLKQLDSIDELINSTPAGEAAIVLWDARTHADPAAVLSRLHLHSSRFAIIALDDVNSDDAWALPIQHRQVVAHAALPIDAALFPTMLETAREEVNSRLALLGESTTPPPFDPPILSLSSPKKSWLLPALLGGVLIAVATAFVLTRGRSDAPAPTAHHAPSVFPAAPEPASAPVPAPAPVAAPGSQPGTVDSANTTSANPAGDIGAKVDALVEKAQQAMAERHFIDPVAGSALSLYREALMMEPDNGEARQGLQRLSEILIARVQSALDDRKFDVALQFLETARSIDPSEKRLAALDEKMVSLRAELGPAQILAALNAQNFDRATQLIDEAARTRALPAAKLVQLREELHRRTDEAEVSGLLKLVDARIQQDHVIEPRNDSAIYYLNQAKQSGAGPAAWQSGQLDVQRRLMQMGRAAIQQKNFAEVERILTEMRGMGATQGSMNSLLRDFNAARSQSAALRPDLPPYLELAQSRLAQGRVTEPDNDSALFYVNQLRAADPKNAGLAQVSNAVQAQIIEHARSSLDSGDVERSEALAQLAAGLGASPDLDALSERIRQRRAGGDVLQMPEQSLTRLNKLDVLYPPRALQSNVEGWVELNYTVAPDGSVTKVTVTNSAPSKTFDASAIKAVSRLRYRPVVKNGKAIAVGTQLRIVYRLPK